MQAKNSTDDTIVSPLLEIGLPPGFTVQPGELEDLALRAGAARYEVGARRIVFYLTSLAPGQTFRIAYGLLARTPVESVLPESRAYPYYNPERADYTMPAELKVRH